MIKQNPQVNTTNLSSTQLISQGLKDSYKIPENVTMQEIKNYSQNEEDSQLLVKGQLEGFQNEYKELTDRVIASNAQSKSFVGVVGLIKEAPTLTDKVCAVTNMLDLVPGVGKVKRSIFGSYIGSNIGQALTEQYQTIHALNARLIDFVFNEKSGLRQNSKDISSILRTSQQKYITTRQTLEDLTQTFSDKQTQITPEIEELEKRYNGKFDELDIDKLEVEDFKIYMKCAEVVDELTEDTHKISGVKNEIKGLVNIIQGKKIDLGNATTLLVTGRKMSENLTQLLEESESGVSSIANVAEFQQLMAHTATQVGEFKNNFNDALAVTTRQTKELSEIGDKIIPSSIYKLDTLVQSSIDISEGAQNFLNHHGISAKDELNETLKELSVISEKEDVRLIENEELSN